MIRLIKTELDHQRGKLILWCPILLGCGIAVYFGLPHEPNFLILQLVALSGLILAFLAWRLVSPLSLAPAIMAFIILGFLLGSFRAHSVSGPVLGWRYYGAIEGTVVAIDRSASDKQRLTLQDPILAKVAPSKTPYRVRVSLHSKVSGFDPQPGSRVLLTAHLSPPNGPTEPAGYDFQRRAWFKRLGAIGYSRSPVMQASEVEQTGFTAWVFKTRMTLSAAIQSHVGGKEGGFAAAILTGDRSVLDPEAVNDLRRSNLAHLLAISGLHMGLMTGVVFAIFRYGFALVPAVALRLPSKKLAAVAALLAGFSYLILSGASVATERAFIMVAIMLGAVLLDRPALSLRAVAIAATIILVLWPENLMEPGFQMSFAATSALVVAFGWLSKNPIWRGAGARGFRFGRSIASLVFSSLVAGLATAPIAAFHFNQVAHFGLIANTASLPVMGFVVMPSAVAATVLTPLGLDWLAWNVMGMGIKWILDVAHWLAGFESAVSLVPSAPAFTLGGFVLAASILVAFQTFLRWAGFGVAAIVLLFWSLAERPDLLLSDDGRLAGVMTEKGRALNRERGSGFAANSWLENDGDKADQKSAAERLDSIKGQQVWQIKDTSVGYLWEKEPDDFSVGSACLETKLLIVPRWKGKAPAGCVVLDTDHFRKSGSTAIWFNGDETKIKTARQSSGTRLWNSKEVRGQ